MKKLLVLFSIFGITALPAMAAKSNCRDISDLLESYCKSGLGGIGGDCCDTNANRKIQFVCNFYKDNVDTTKIQNEVKELCGLTSASQVDLYQGKTPYSPTTSTAKSTTAQTITASGTVQDNNGETLPGASVTIPGTTTGVTADANGKFVLNNIPSNSTLEISFVGCTKQQVTASAQMGTISLNCGNTLDEIAVVACAPDKANGIQAKENIDGTCYPSQCITPRWELSGSGKKAKCVEQKCKIDHGTGEWVQDGDTWKCKITSCDKNWKKDDEANPTKCIEMLRECNATDKQKLESEGASKTGIKKGTETCIAQDCKCGYTLKNDACVKWAENEACVADVKPELPKNATAGTKSCNDKGKAYCKVTDCAADYKVNDDATKCISVKGDECDSGDANAVSTKYKKQDGKMVCIITECASKYEPNDDQTQCVPKKILSKEDSEAQIAELKDNAQKMKDKEQSTENKLLGAVGMGATGIGLMQTLSAGAEQDADEAAERDMSAYLATMHCNYGGGKNIAGGETAVELPGGNELTPLYAEYVQLANDLKIRKTALDMRPGIESETLLDKSQTGLYDDIALGKTDGAYTSLARALSDETSADAAEWAQQKADTADKKKTGLIVAGVGAVGSLVGNLAINSGKNKQDKTDEILAKYEPLKKVFKDAEQQQATLPQKQCSEFKGTTGTGTAPNCSCTKQSEYFNMEQDGCVECTGGYAINSARTGCECLSPRIESKGQCIEKNAECKLSGLVANPNSANCTCTQHAVQNNNNCACDTANGFTQSDTDCICDTNANKEESNGKCVCKNGYENNDGVCTPKQQGENNDPIQAIITQDVPQVPEVVAEINIQADTTFASGSAKIDNTKAQSFLNDFSAQMASQTEALRDTEYCVEITGHTDRTKFKPSSSWNNQRLSQARADAIKDTLVKQDSSLTNKIKSTGRAEAECTTTTYPQPNDARCRRVNVKVVTGNCTTD